MHSYLFRHLIIRSNSVIFLFNSFIALSSFDKNGGYKCRFIRATMVGKVPRLFLFSKQLIKKYIIEGILVIEDVPF